MCGAALGAAAAAVAASACGASSAGSNFGESGSGADGGAAGQEAETFDSAAFDSFPSEGSPETGPPPPPATVTFVHASPSLNDTRLCWTLPSSGSSGDAGGLTDASPFPSGAPMPASNFPGLPVGGAVQLSPATSLAVASAAGPVDLYAIDAVVLAKEANGALPSSCEALVCVQNSSSACLRPNKDYWHVGTLPPRAIAPSGPTFVALAGCVGTALDPAANAGRCGANWDAVAGNLHVEVLHVATPSHAGEAGIVSDASGIAVQSVLLSPALAASLPEAGAARVSFGTSAEAGTVALLSSEDDIEPSFPLALGMSADIASFGQVGFAVDALLPDAAASGHFWTSLAQAQSLVDPTLDPRVYFGAHTTYVVAVLGDPSAPSPFSGGDAAYDGRGLHVLVLASLPAN